MEKRGCAERVEERIHDDPRGEMQQTLVAIQHRLHPHARERHLGHPRLRAAMLRLLHQKINLQRHRHDDHHRVIRRLAIVPPQIEPTRGEFQLEPAILASKRPGERRRAPAALPGQRFLRPIRRRRSGRPRRPSPLRRLRRRSPSVPARSLPPRPRPRPRPRVPIVPVRVRVRVPVPLRDRRFAIDRFERPGGDPRSKRERTPAGIRAGLRVVERSQTFHPLKLR